MCKFNISAAIVSFWLTQEVKYALLDLQIQAALNESISNAF